MALHHGSAPASYLFPFSVGNKGRRSSIFVLPFDANRRPYSKAIGEVNVVNNQFKVNLPGVDEDIIENSWAKNFEEPYAVVKNDIINGIWPLSQESRDIVANFMSMSMHKNHGLLDTVRGSVVNLWSEIIEKNNVDASEAAAYYEEHANEFDAELLRIIHNKVPHVGRLISKFPWSLVRSETPFITGDAPVTLAMKDGPENYVGTRTGKINDSDLISMPISRHLAIHIEVRDHSGNFKGDYLRNRSGSYDDVIEDIRASKYIVDAILASCQELYIYPEDKEEIIKSESFKTSIYGTLARFN